MLCSSAKEDELARRVWCIPQAQWLMLGERTQWVYLYFDHSQNCILAALASSASSYKTSIGSLFEVDPNYLVWIEWCRGFVSRKALDWQRVGRRGLGLLFLSLLPLLSWKFSAGLQKSKEGKTHLCNFVLHYDYWSRPVLCTFRQINKCFFF